MFIRRRPILVLSIALVACAAEAVTVGDINQLPPPSQEAEAGLPLTPPDGTSPDTGAPRPTCGELVCPAFSFCYDGGCQCPKERSALCDDACVDLQTDVLHCGACGNACSIASSAFDAGGDASSPGATASCAIGACRVIEDFPLLDGTPLMSRGEAIAFDDDFVYVLTERAILRAPRATLWPFTRIATVNNGKPGMVVTDTHIYYATRGSVFVMPKGDLDGGVATLLPVPGGLQTDFARSATHLYIGNRSGVRRLAFADGTIEELLTQGVSAIAVEGDSLYFAEYGFCGQGSLPIARLDLTTMERTDIASSEDVRAIVTTGDGIAWAAGACWDGPDQYGDRAVFRWTGATNKIEQLHGAGAMPTGIAFDGARLFWTNGRGPELDDETHSHLTILPGANGPVTRVATTGRTDTLGDVPGAVVMHAPVVVDGSLLWLDYVGHLGATNQQTPVLRRLTPR
ncbi:MAG: hypothetical protein J0I07_26245 [Myxococcales bacterium]|nr:hypothetical protein [Myxococcales bacterium]